MSENIIVVYITCKDREEAGKISKYLIEKRLVACANIFPIESMYWWKGKIEESSESSIFAKTIREKFDQVKEAVKEIHSYDVPLIECWNVDGINKDYLDYLKGEVKND